MSRNILFKSAKRPCVVRKGFDSWQGQISVFTNRNPDVQKLGICLPLIIIIIIIIISFMKGIYTYIPKTNCVPTQYSVAAILLLLFMVLISLVSVLNLMYCYISTLQLLLLLSSSSSSSSPLCRVFILIFLRQTVSLRNTVLQLFCCYYSRCLYRQFQCSIYCTVRSVLSAVCVQCPI